MQRRSSTQDISWFLDLRLNKQLDLDPPYQRRSVWNPKDRRFFLDTVFNGYPCPPIFLHKALGPDQKSVYAVVDGKQRLQTLFMFVDGEIALADDFGDVRFNGKTWAEIGQDERPLFWDYVIPVEFLNFDAQDTRVVNQAFDRLNRNMRKLEPQELRHARWDGWFIKLVERECEDPIWKSSGLGIVTNARSKRMKDAQFISELLLILIENSQFGFDQDLLDATYAKYDELDEADQTLNADEVLEKLEAAKRYLLAMEASNGCIRDHARTLAAFYTLWAIVVLDEGNLPAAPAFAAIYTEFMQQVVMLKDSGTVVPEFGPQVPILKLVEDYLHAYGGASTDLAPRTKRLAALREYVKNRQQ